LLPFFLGAKRACKLGKHLVLADSKLLRDEGLIPPRSFFMIDVPHHPCYCQTDLQGPPEGKAPQFPPAEEAT